MLSSFLVARTQCSPSLATPSRLLTCFWYLSPVLVFQKVTAVSGRSCLVWQYSTVQYSTVQYLLGVAVHHRQREVGPLVVGADVGEVDEAVHCQRYPQRPALPGARRDLLTRHLANILKYS